jgi:hypothetical protein
MMSLLKEFSGIPGPKKVDLKKSDSSDAGSSDVADKAKSSDVSFSLMRNTINSDGEVTGSDVADYLERATELNDEVDTVPFGLETDDGDVVKVYVNADEADKFEEAMKKLLGIEDDIEEAINKLALDFDIVDVVWPKSKKEDGEEEPVELDAAGEFDGLSDDDEDPMDVVAEYDPLEENLEEALDASEDQAAAYRKLSAIANNLLALSPAGVQAETGFERKNFTKHEMITKYIKEKFSSDREILRTWIQESNNEPDVDVLPFWLR